MHPEHSCNKVLLGAIFDNAHLPEIKDAALKWCEEASLEDAEAVLSSEQRLSEELGLKVLERKRLLAALGKIMDARRHSHQNACMDDWAPNSSADPLHAAQFGHMWTPKSICQGMQDVRPAR